MAGVPDNFSLAQACPISCTLLTFFLLAACSIHETEQKGYCENIITKMHLDKLQELIDSQMLMSCHVSFEFIDAQQLDDEICFVKAAFPRLEDILDKMKFKKNSDNFNKTKDVRNMYKKIDENEVPCIDDQDDHERELSQACSKEFSMPPEKMLQLVKNFFSQVMVLLDKNVDFKRDCSKTYQKCSDAPKKELLSPGVVTDRDCSCPSPSSPCEGPPASPHPALAAKPFPSTVPHLGSKEAAASTRLPHSRPGATQTPVKLDSSAKPRVPRSTHRGLSPMESQWVWPVSSPPAELGLAPASRGPGSGLPVSGGEMLRREEIHPTRTEAERIQAWSTGLREFLHLPADPSGQLVTPLPNELWPIPSLGSEEPISIVQHRLSRMAATTDSPAAPETPPGGSPRHPAGQEPYDSLAGPIPDLNILPPSTDQRRKEAQPKETQREVMSYVLVAILATVAILLAVGGLLFYKHKSRVSSKTDPSTSLPQTQERRPPRSGNDLEEQEGR
uniref:Macrophage colony-stimulating factor 1 n=1 Tax=Chelydra serpentina TaxID=8475 RepID=A0A8C3T5B5_CHESE